MTRRYQPDGTLLLSAALGRIDVLEESVTQAAADVAAIGRGLGDVTGQLRRLTQNTSTQNPGTQKPGTQSSGAGRGGTSAAVGGHTAEQGDDEPQWDWFAIDDPGTARTLIEAVDHFTTEILTHYGLSLAPACWAVHPPVMADLLALLAERQTAYAGPNPTPVSEWLTRWAPAGLERIRQALAGCLAERGHRHHGRTYDLTRFDPHAIPVWWATDRTTDPVEAFALTPLT